MSPLAPTGNGWLTGPAVIEVPHRRLGRALTASLLVHAVFLALVLLVFAIRPDVAQNVTQQLTKVFYLQDPGPAGGGGGHPSQAAPRRMEIARATPPAPVVATMAPPPEPAPVLDAPVTTNALVSLAGGTSAVALAGPAGGGRGPGLGPGSGPGVGPGNDGGFGGGARQLGAGITSPVPLRRIAPKYTTPAMVAKIQGTAVIEAVVRADGTVGDVRVLKSLDKADGLDNEGLTAVRSWLFRPATDASGRPIDVIVQIYLDFTLH